MSATAPREGEGMKEQDINTDVLDAEDRSGLDVLKTHSHFKPGTEFTLTNRRTWA